VSHHGSSAIRNAITILQCLPNWSDCLNTKSTYSVIRYSIVERCYNETHCVAAFILAARPGFNSRQGQGFFFFATAYYRNSLEETQEIHEKPRCWYPLHQPARSKKLGAQCPPHIHHTHNFL
jgi:hypothetical protein